jgi:hypothetical protein
MPIAILRGPSGCSSHPTHGPVEVRNHTKRGEADLEDAQGLELIDLAQIDKAVSGAAGKDQVASPAHIEARRYKHI